MSRVFGIELRRSAALGSALSLAVIGIVLIFFAEGIDFADGWMQLAMTQRLYLALLWPLALAAGAWQARREHRSNTAELFTSTPRPRMLRMMPTLGAMAVAVVAGYLAVGLAGGLWIAGTAEYLPLAAVPAVVAVGGLSLIAAVWLGLAAGRLLPSPVTAPALAVAGLAVLLFIPWATRPRGWLAMVFSPIDQMNLPGAYATVPGRVSVAQACWMAALAITAVLLATGGRRLRVAALVPALAGAALAITVMPHRNRTVTDSLDPVARKLVCTQEAPRVCVSRVHSGLLTEVVPAARDGLAALAKLPGAPKEVHEDTTTYPSDGLPVWREDVVLLRVVVAQNGHLAAESNATEVVDGAFAVPPGCDIPVDPADRLAAASWLLGREPVSTEPGDDGGHGQEILAQAGQRWQGLRKLPAGEALARVAALRRAAATCSAGDDMLTGGKP